MDAVSHTHHQHTGGDKNVDPSTFELRQSFDSIALLFLRQEDGKGQMISAAADTRTDYDTTRDTTRITAYLRMQRHIGHLQFSEHDGQLLARATGARENNFAGLGLQRLNQVDKVAVPRLKRGGETRAWKRGIVNRRERVKRRSHLGIRESREADDAYGSSGICHLGWHKDVLLTQSADSGLWRWRHVAEKGLVQLLCDQALRLFQQRCAEQQILPLNWQRLKNGV